MRPLLCVLLITAALAACGRSEPGAKGAGKAASAADAKAKAAPLLLAPEDLRTLNPSLQATGPVISGSLQPERRADLRAEVGALVQQVLKENGEPVNYRLLTTACQGKTASKGQSRSLARTSQASTSATGAS